MHLYTRCICSAQVDLHAASGPGVVRNAQCVFCSHDAFTTRTLGLHRPGNPDTLLCFLATRACTFSPSILTGSTLLPKQLQILLDGCLDALHSGDDFGIHESARLPQHARTASAALVGLQYEIHSLQQLLGRPATPPIVSA